MTLPYPKRSRVLKHTRTVDVKFYQREDELWDIDCRFTDVKTHDLILTSVLIPAKRPLHDMLMRITINPQGLIVDAHVSFDEVPFEGYCEAIQSRYKQLIGLNIMHHFRHDLHERFKGVHGCTHMNELAEAIPSVAMQVFVFGDETDREKAGFQKDEERPFHMDLCHCMDSTGPAVKRFYPTWALSQLPPKKK